MASISKRPDAIGDFPLGSPILDPVFLCAMLTDLSTGVLHLYLVRISFYFKPKLGSRSQNMVILLSSLD
jgi:hypothetical protein